MQSILQSCTPRPEILQGELNDAIFAAEFGLILEGRADPVYQEAERFLANTHPTQNLKQIVETVFDKLANPADNGGILRLSTGFGGGKTHALLALWHLAHNIANPSLGQDFLSTNHRVGQIAIAGLDGKLLGSSGSAAQQGVKAQSLFGEIAYQLQGPVGYNQIRDIDLAQESPDAETVRSILPDNQPVLILVDELPVYLARLDEGVAQKLLATLDILIYVVTSTPQAILVVTDTAAQFSYQSQASQIEKVMAQRIDGIIERKATSYNPIGDESTQVIIRRLFQAVDGQSAVDTAQEYANAYQRMAEEQAESLPAEVKRADYQQELQDCYPFHPCLLNTVQNRLGALEDFQQSRGVLRLFARILRQLWEKGGDLPLVNAGDLDWSSDRLRADLLDRLKRQRFRPAADADVLDHARQLDNDHSTDIHQRVASAILLESLPLNANAAVTKQQIGLATLRPQDVGFEVSDGVDRLMRSCWHLYRDNIGKYQFRYEPNANKIIEERSNSILVEDERQKVRSAVQSYFNGAHFELQGFPSTPSQVRDSAKLKLVLAESEQVGQAVCDYLDPIDLETPRRRPYRNAIFAITPTANLLQDAIQARRRLTAAEQVEREEKDKRTDSRKKSPLLEQVEELIPTFRRNAQIALIQAFNCVLFQDRQAKTLDNRYLVDEQALSGSKKGQDRLLEFLQDNNLVYKSGETIFAQLLLDLVKGATPSLEHEGAYSASSIHERALVSKQLRLILNESVIRESLIKAVNSGDLVVRLANGDVFDNQGRVSGTASNRQRDRQRLTTLLLESDVLIAPTTASCVEDWLKISDQPPIEDLLTVIEAADQKETSVERVLEAVSNHEINAQDHLDQTLIVKDHVFSAWNPDQELVEDGDVSASSWEQAIEYATDRPLLDLRFSCQQTENANKLLICSQPFDVASAKLTVTASGDFDDGGQLNFKMGNVKPNNPLKPLDMAKRMLRGVSDNPHFWAEISMDWRSEGMFPSRPKLEQAYQQGQIGIGLRAAFGRKRD